MRRKGEMTSSRRAIEFPYRVAMRVPPMGLGNRLNRMNDWCSAHGAEIITDGFRSGATDFVMFCFRDRAIADAFEKELPTI